MTKRKTLGTLFLLASFGILSAGIVSADWVDNIPWGVSPSELGGHAVFVEAKWENEYFRDASQNLSIESISLESVTYVFCHNRLAGVFLKLKDGIDFEKLRSYTIRKFGAPGQQHDKYIDSWSSEEFYVTLDKRARHGNHLSMVGMRYYKPPSETDKPLVEQFKHKNVSYTNSSFGSDIIGELINNSGSDFDISSFSISLYSPDGDLIDVVHFTISRFQRGQTRSFTATSLKNMPKGVRFKIQLESGF